VTWNTVPLGEVVERVGRAGPDPRGRTFSYVDLSSIDAASKTITTATDLLSEDAPSRARQNLIAGDVLVSTVRPNLNGVAVVPASLDGAVGSTGFSVLRARFAALDPRYLFHWVRTPAFIDNMTRRSTGASYPAVTDAVVKASPIPLPPLPEQSRIAAILDEVDAVRDALRRANQASGDAARGLFASTFGRVDQLQRAEGTRDLSLLASVIDCPHSTPEWTSAGVTCIRTSNLGRGEWDWSDHRYVSESTHAARTRRSELFEGDIVLSREGTVGVAAIVPPGLRMSMGQRLVQVRLDSSQIEPEYLLHYLLQATSPQIIGHLMVGSTSTHLNVRDLRRLRVFVPPLDDQQRFAAQIGALARVRDAGLKRADALDELFASLQHRAFRGEL